MRRNLIYVGSAIFLVLLTFIPMTNYSARTYAWVAAVAIMLLGFNIILGIASQMVFSHSFFWGVGAYTSGVLMVYDHWSFVPAVIVGTISASVSAWLFAVLLVRLKGWTLAIASFIPPLILPELVQVLQKYTGGSDGLLGIPMPTQTIKGYLVLLIIVAVVCYWMAQNLVDSPLGRSWRASGYNELIASSVGIDVGGSRLSAFVYSAFFAGVSGALFGSIFGFLSPNTFDLDAMLNVLVGSVVGGATSMFGAVLGAFLIVWLPQQLVVYAENAALIYAVVLLLALRYMPKGIVGTLKSLRYRYASTTGLPERQPRRTLVQLARLGTGPGPQLATASGPNVSTNGAHPADAVATNGSGTAEPTPEPLVHTALGRDRSADLVLRCDAVTIAYGGVVAVDGVSLTLRGGEFKGLIGPNGAGKSSLFNAIGGFARLAGGDVWVGTTRLTKLAPEPRGRHGIARTFQETQSFGDFTALENVMLGAQLGCDRNHLRIILRLPSQQRSERAVRAKAEGLLELVGLGGLGRRHVADFAYGDQKLLQIARALAQEPEFLLLDEPAAGLNSVEVQRLAELLQRVRDSGVGVLLVEHNVPFVTSLCDVVMVMDHGLLIAEGTKDEILASEAVRAAYLGHAAAPSIEAAEAVVAPSGGGQ